MKTSESIIKISAAIVAAQAQVKGAFKDGKNTFFKNAQGQASQYATLDSVIEASRESLSNNKLAVLQAPIKLDDSFYVETRVQHESGEFYEILTPLLFSKMDMQAYGSAITYAKRYALGSLLNISTDGDDDGNGTQKPQIEQAQPVKKEVVKKQEERKPSDNLTGMYMLQNGKLKDKFLKDLTKFDLEKQHASMKAYFEKQGDIPYGTIKDDFDAIVKHLKTLEVKNGI